MEELERILRQHGARYPGLQSADGVKLIYQNEFGGGHLVKDRQAFFAYLEREYAAVEKDPAGEAVEDIGNGLCRVYLTALPREKLSWLGDAFLRSAQEHCGSLPSFLEKLELLRTLTREGIFSFSPAQLEAYLADYAARGYPMVSHSPEYKALYKPAYRIIRKVYAEKMPLRSR